MATTPQQPIRPAMRLRIGGFFRRRIRRVIGYSLIGGLIAVLYGMQDIAPYLAPGWAYVVSAGSFSEFLTGFADFLIFEAIQILFFGIVFLCLGQIAGFVIAMVITALLPRKMLPIVDGVLWAIVFITVLNTTGLETVVEALPFGTFSDLVALWIFFGALSGLVWNRLPFGMRHSDTSIRVIDMPIEAARARLIPDIAPEITLADANWRQEFGPMPDTGYSLDTARTGRNRFSFCETPDRPGNAYRSMTYRISAPAPGQTRLEIDLVLNSVSPLAWWEFWTRPYAEDYADHLVARLTGQKDRSVYGALAKRSWKRLDRRMRKQQAA